MTKRQGKRGAKVLSLETGKKEKDMNGIKDNRVGDVSELSGNDRNRIVTSEMNRSCRKMIGVE